MSGGRKDYKARGIIPRLLAQLFTELRGIPDHDCRVWVQYLEIYNENLFDLLDITTQVRVCVCGGGRATTCLTCWTLPHRCVCVCGGGLPPF